MYLQQVACDNVSFCWCRAGIRNTCLAAVTDSSAKTFLAIIKACILPGTTVVSDCWGYNVRLHNDGLIPLRWFFFGTWILTITIKATWMHVKVNIRPY
jgi:hypothetical protein